MTLIAMFPVHGVWGNLYVTEKFELIWPKPHYVSMTSTHPITSFLLILSTVSEVEIHLPCNAVLIILWIPFPLPAMSPSLSTIFNSCSLALFITLWNILKSYQGIDWPSWTLRILISSRLWLLLQNSIYAFLYLSLSIWFILNLPPYPTISIPTHKKNSQGS